MEPAEGADNTVIEAEDVSATYMEESGADDLHLDDTDDYGLMEGGDDDMQAGGSSADNLGEGKGW